MIFQLILVVIGKLLEWQLNYALLNQISLDFNCIFYLNLSFVIISWIFMIFLQPQQFIFFLVGKCSCFKQTRTNKSFMLIFTPFSTFFSHFQWKWWINKFQHPIFSHHEHFLFEGNGRKSANIYLFIYHLKFDAFTTLFTKL